ncbi:hypothetical protein D3C79_1060100 [compost metagenome]
MLAAVVVPGILGQIVGRFKHPGVAISTISVLAIFGYCIGVFAVPALLAVPSDF